MRNLWYIPGIYLVLMTCGENEEEIAYLHPTGEIETLTALAVNFEFELTSTSITSTAGLTFIGGITGCAPQPLRNHQNGLRCDQYWGAPVYYNRRYSIFIYTKYGSVKVLNLNKFHCPAGGSVSM